MFIDVHCHIDRYSDEEIARAIEKAERARVGIIINNGLNPESNRRTLLLAEKYQEVKAALGFYPIDLLELSETDIAHEIEFEVAVEIIG